jgi:hypothetical protein
MEENQDILKNALSRLPDYEPEDGIWLTLTHKLDEQPLKGALKELPEYEPGEMLWDLIARKTPTGKSPFIQWYAAAMVLFCLGTGWWIFSQNDHQPVSFSEETIDSRLQSEAGQRTDQQYKLLKAYCETETLVCNSKNYKQLQQEYEKLNDASQQLQQAMGAYNTEAELVRQFNMVEEQKADVLNEMAKMI